jgi:hypothetical protein
MFIAEFGNVGHFVVGCLAVAGGFLVGNLLVLLICRLLAKLVLTKRMPVLLERALRVLGGLALAVLVAFLVFDGSGGSGGGGILPGSNGGTNATPSDNKQGPLTVPTTAPKPPEDVVLDRKVTVTVLRASPNPTRFRFPGEAGGVEIADAKKRLDALARESRDHVKLEVLIYQDSSGESNEDVSEFRRYADELKLHPNFIKKPGPVPE